MKALLLNMLLAAMSHSLFAQVSKDKTLLIGEFAKDSGNEQEQLLVGLHFSNGLLERRDTIYKGPAFKTVNGESNSFFRLEFTNQIYKRRYFITFGGVVIDMTTRQMLKAADGNLTEERGDTLVFLTENLFRGTYYTYLNLHTGQLSRKYLKDFVKDKSEDAVAPGGDAKIRVDYSQLPYRIFLTKHKTKELIVHNAGVGTPLNSDASFPAVPIYWWDDHRFLYVRFDAPPLDRGYTGTVFFYNIALRSEQAIGFLGKVERVPINAKFSRDTANGLLLRAGWNYFHVMPEKAQVSKINRFGLDAGFSYNLYRDSNWKQKIYYRDDEIGDMHFLGSFPTEGFLALGLRDKGTYTGPDRIGVWNDFTRTWQIIPEPQLIDIFGWIEN